MLASRCPRLAVTAALTAALLGCDRDGKPAAPPAPAVATAPPPPPPPYVHAPGPAYLAIDEVGLFRLDDGQLTRVLAHGYTFHDLALAPDGALYALAIGGLWKVTPTAVEDLSASAPSLLDKIAVGPDGVLWATDRREIHRWDGAWTSEPASTFDGDDQLIEDLVVDRDGRVWVVQNQRLWRLDGDRWNQVDTRFAGLDQPFLGAIAIRADGAIYLSGLRGTFAFRDGAWRETGLTTPYGSLDELTTGPAGHVAGSGGVDSIAVERPDGTLRSGDLSDGPARARRGDVLAVDGAGRTWITTDNGLAIFADDGSLLQQWLPGTIAGVNGKVSAIAVVGDGPTLPTPTAPVTGAVIGRVLRDGRPIAGAAVELCDLPLTVFRRSPCEASSVIYRATTARDGSFELPDVAVGGYGFAFKPDANWVVLIARTCCTALTAGARYDVGDLTLR